LSLSFHKIVQAMGLYDHWFDVQFAAHIDSDQWAQHAVQSIVWNAAGNVDPLFMKKGVEYVQVVTSSQPSKRTSSLPSLQ
jgi:hypothetical protein